MHGKAQHVSAWRRSACKITKPKFTECLINVDGSSTLLTRASVLRSSHPLWNASTQNEGVA